VRTGAHPSGILADAMRALAGLLAYGLECREGLIFREESHIAMFAE